MAMSAETVALQFVEAINHADLERLGALMTEGHVFIDSDGSQVAGRASVLRAWSEYFSMMHDYRVIVRERFSSVDTVVLVGTAEGVWATTAAASHQSRWSVPAAWRAVVDGATIAVWQVFVNPEPIRAALRGDGGSAA
jgi:ketosteroid isomerase-like protein